MGHSNVQTDIKEANFLGGADEMVAAGSDDGHVFIYDANTGRPVSSGGHSSVETFRQDSHSMRKSRDFPPP